LTLACTNWRLRSGGLDKDSGRTRRLRLTSSAFPGADGEMLRRLDDLFYTEPFYGRMR